MNKLKFKKLLTFFVVLTLIASVCLFAACDKDEDTTDTEETVTRTPSFTNGNFTEYTTSSSEDVYPFAPDDFTTSPTSSQIEGVELTDTISGIISLSDYDKYKSNWGDLAKITKSDISSYSDDDKVNYGDSNVLMIYNTKPAYYMYKGTFTGAQKTVYKLSVDVYTTGLNEGSNRGATIKVTGSSSTVATEGYAIYECIQTDDAWETYSFYITGKDSGSTTLGLQLMLGNNNVEDDYLTSGYAFFDNIRYETVDAVADTLANNEQAIYLQYPNTQFDYKTSSNLPFLYSKLSSSGSSTSNIVNLGDGTSNVKIADSAETEYTNPGYNAGNNDKYNVYAISTDSSYTGYYSSSTVYFTRGGLYKLTLDINTINVTAGNAYFGISTSSTTSSATLATVVPNSAWTTATVYYYVNENTSKSLYLHFGLGDSTTTATGVAFFDNLTITTEGVDGTITGANVFDDRIQDTNLIKDTAWTQEDIDATTTGISTSKTDITSSVLDASIELPYKSAQAFNIDKNLSFVATKPSIAKATIGYTLSKNTCYRFSTWIKTIDVQTTSGVTLTVLDADDNAIVSYSAVTTTDDATLNGYRELVCFFHTAQADQDITFNLAFGSGSQWTSTTLFNGTAYIVNSSLITVDYEDYEDASSSGTYEKKYDWNTTTSGSFDNGQFDNYDYSETLGINDGGMSGDPAEFQKTKFAVPDCWDMVGDTTSTGIVAGIADLDRSDLITNLATATNGADIASLLTGIDSSKYAKYGNYVGGKRALLIYAPANAELQKSYVHVGYQSDDFTLSASSYYEISVLVKVVDGTASIYLTSDNNMSETNGSDMSKYEDIAPLDSSYTDTNGWKRYTFYVQVGFSSVTANLNLYLGGNDGTDTQDGKGGLVFFDYITMNTLTEDEYLAKTTTGSATCASDPVDPYEDTKAVVLNVDGFGLSDPDEDIETPSGWTKSLLSESADEDTEGNVYGVAVKHATYVARSGDNCLVISVPNVAAAVTYTQSSAKTFTKECYYKVSVWAKATTIQGGKAYIKLAITDYDDKVLYVKTDDNGNSDWTEYAFFIKAPSADDDFGTNAANLSAKVVLGLGEIADDDATESATATGTVLFDDVLIEKLNATTVEEVNTIMSNYSTSAQTSLAKYDSLEKNTEEDPTSKDEDDDEDSSDFNWIIFMSVAFGAIIVIIVVIYFIKKILPKRKANAVDRKKTTKKKEEEYKDLKD